MNKLVCQNSHTIHIIKCQIPEVVILCRLISMAFLKLTQEFLCCWATSMSETVGVMLQSTVTMSKAFLAGYIPEEKE